jgi:hypothetical protein
MNEIFSGLTQLFVQANALSPVAVIALLVGVLYVQIWKQPSKQELNIVKDNHLHDLPAIAANTAAVAESLRRMENAQTAGFTEVVTRLEIMQRGK